MDLSWIGNGFRVMVYLGIALILAFAVGSALGFVGGVNSIAWFGFAFILLAIGFMVFIGPLIG